MPYVGYSMSLNAAIAYENGEKPISKWTKEALLSAAGEKAEMLKKLTTSEIRDLILYRSSWHHTSSHYNATDFYAIDEEKVEEITENTIQRIISGRKPRETKPKETPRTVWAEVTYTIWEGRYANYRRPRKITETITFSAGDKMVHTSYGNKRLSSMENVRVLDDETK